MIMQHNILLECLAKVYGYHFAMGISLGSLAARQPLTLAPRWEKDQGHPTINRLCIIQHLFEVDLIFFNMKLIWGHRLVLR
jgi:hypothetical protein